VDNQDGTKGAAPVRPILAVDRVRHVGEPIAFVVAETLAAARDAAELIEVDFDDDPVKLDIAPGGNPIHDEAPDNVAYDWALGDEAATDAALAGAARVVTLTTYDNRVIVNSLEPRGCSAEMEDGRLHVAINGQGVWGHKTDLARWFRLDEAQVRVTNPDVGGGFGMKAMRYPEHFLVALAARETGRPVHWMSDRTEAMLSDNAGRDLDVTCTLGFDADHRLVAYKVDSLSNMGAYNSQFGQNIQSSLFSKVLTGTYDVQTVHFRNRGIYTNTIQVDAYRGAGRPEAIYALERAMDYAARELGVDPRNLRRGTSSGPTSFPTNPPAASSTMSGISRLFWTAQSGRRTSRAFRRGARLRRRTESCGGSGSAITSNPSSARRTRRRRSSSPRPAPRSMSAPSRTGRGTRRSTPSFCTTRRACRWRRSRSCRATAT
jgi:carbon-monoxide dehydrogenase large subunit